MKKAIRAHNISKRYLLGTSQNGLATLRDSVADFFRSPLRRLRSNGDLGSEVWALQDINFEVDSGEVVGIVGRNGAGKSTLLKILSRITEPTAGEMTISGRVGSLLEVGTGFHPELTGRENVYLNGAVLGMSRREIDRRFDEIIDFSGVERFLDTPVKRYSTGMYMRLAFSVAAHLETEILLVDEVLAVGDAAFQKKCISKMREVSQAGGTVLFVSHNLPSITMLCNRALLISDGKLIADGSSQEVVEAYLSEGLATEPLLVFDDRNTAPGTERIRLRSVRVVGADGGVKRTFGIDEPINVEIDYWVLQNGLETNAGYHLYNSHGILVFISQDLHDKQWFDAPKEAGCYRSIGQIPGKLLNEGLYTLDVAVFESPGPATDVFQKQAIAFEVIDSGASEVRGRYTGQWLVGVLRPSLPWTTTRINDAG
jgi:lipopolysaccharide transport system ATP-binding protein